MSLGHVDYSYKEILKNTGAHGKDRAMSITQNSE